jgi:hypothetical protein
MDAAFLDSLRATAVAAKAAHILAQQLHERIVARRLARAGGVK